MSKRKQRSCDQSRDGRHCDHRPQGWDRVVVCCRCFRIRVKS